MLSSIASLDTVEDLLLSVPPGFVDDGFGPRYKRHQPFRGSTNDDRLMNLTEEEVKAAYDQAAAHIFQHKIAYGTVLDLLEEESWLSLGDTVLDQALGGRGLLAQGITEIAGESAVGKTQMCLQLCLMVQLPKEYGGLDGSAVWLSTEGKFPYTRLESLMCHFMDKYGPIVPGLTPESIRANVYFDSLADQETQLHVFNYQLPILINNSHEEAAAAADELNPTLEHDSSIDEGTQRPPKKKPIRLIIIDSIANNFRGELTVSPSSGAMGDSKGPTFRTSLLQRSADLCEIGLRLRALSDDYGLVVICVNQVTDVFRPGTQAYQNQNQNHHQYHSGGQGGVDSIENKKKPALGLVWENTINTRIVLQRTRVAEHSNEEGAIVAPDKQEPQRSMAVVFAPWAWASSDTGRDQALQDGYCAFRIDDTGVRGIASELEGNF
ncbi:DNA repair protein xrcc3 [Podila epigama]|nr:DNA repair protein xrcc3 [Podila epigama]